MSAHPPRLIVVTGGPGSGKTTVLGLARQAFGDAIHVLPEAASLLFGGGFPRGSAPHTRRASQRAIFYVQRELERQAIEGRLAPTIVCDRGTLDGLAYWPGPATEFHEQLETSEAEQLRRYAAVIHLQVPGACDYNLSNPCRIETPDEAAATDARILCAWSGHPRVHVVPPHADFAAKAEKVLQLLRAELGATGRSPATAPL